MVHFIQAAAGVLLAVILSLSLGKQGKDMATILTIAVCSMVMVLAVAYLAPVLDYLEELKAAAGLNGQMLECLFKVTGIGLLTEMAGMVCTDAGKGSMGKALHLLGASMILWLSMPILRAMMDLIREILGEV